MERRDIPEPGPGEVRLRVLACAMCRTDLHIVDGELALSERFRPRVQSSRDSR